MPTGVLGPVDALPIALDYRGRRIDVLVPSNLPVAEFLPSLVAQNQWLTPVAATRGFTLVTPTGSPLAAEASLSDQGIRPGALLRLEIDDDSTGYTRYDDLVEAMGDSIANTRTAWSPSDSVRLSSYVAAGLVTATGFLLVLGPQPTLAGVVNALAGGLVVLVAALVARGPTKRPLDPSGAVGLLWSATILFGLAAYSFTPSDGPVGLVAAGGGMIVGSAAFFTLRGSARAYMGTPLLVGSVIAGLGVMEWAWSVPANRAAALLIGLVALLVLLLPWIGVARMPVRVAALAPKAESEIVAADVTNQLRIGQSLTLALRVGAGVSAIGLTPMIAIDLTGGLLLTAFSLALLLGTRSLYGRTEVYVGLVTGAATLTLTGVLLALRLPELFVWIVSAAIFVAIFIIADNVISVKLRPRLTRAADILNVLAIAAICPLVALTWGIV
ncbi:MAG: hypothetical protein LBE83_01790 [Propionibacteriaceae bacterium]|jgi:hypothetical protein|nr:hypothetical protein [Propionibacteriaceae bacterium]